MESIKTERMLLSLATDAEMEEKVANAPVPELQQAYREMLEKTGFVPTGELGEEGPRFVHKKKK